MISIPLTHTNKLPLYEQVYQYIKDSIMDGSLSGGSKLPSPRTLAEACGVSRNTISLAYELLQSEGYIDAKQRKGFYVNELTHKFHHISMPNEPIFVPEHIENYTYDFSPDHVDLNNFPYNIWRHLANECIQSKPCFTQGPAQGDWDFRQTVARYLHDSRNVSCDPSQIIIGAGVDYLLWLLSMILGKSTLIAMENPGYERARAIFEHAGNRLIDIPVTSVGIDLQQLKQSKADVCFVTPSHQYPLGCIMPIRERLELITWANETDNRYIIEDDHDSEFRYIGHPIPSLQGSKNKDNVIYLGTFSKAITPAIRVGYMILPEKLLAIYHQQFSLFACTVSQFDQMLLNAFIKEGYFEKHIMRMRKIYKQKHDFTLHQLQQYPVNLYGANSGLSFAVFPPNESSKPYDIEREWISHAKNNNIRIIGLMNYYHPLPEIYKPGFLIGFGGPSLSELESGIELLFNQVLHLS